MSFLKCLCRLAVVAACLAAGSPLLAQTGSGTISGRVTLASDNSPVHGATVIVVGARRTATTNDAGAFTLENVAAGTYDVIAQREHLSAVRQSVTVVAGQTATVVFALTLEAIHEEVAVTASASGTATAFESFSSVTSLDSLELAINRGATLASVLAEQPGVSQRTFGAGNARPVIRGFDGDRVLIMQDGVRTGDLSSQSGDHGVSIDPAGLERLEVVKGPATLLYGSNAIGGVVNAITPQDAFRASPFSGVLGGVSVDTGSVNGQLGGSGNVQYGKGAWTAWAGGGGRRTGDYSTPLGAIANSATDLTNGRGGFGWTGTRAFFSVGVQGERHRFGVPFAASFHAHDHEGDGAAEEDEAFEIDVKSTRRDVRVDTGLRALRGTFLDNVKVTFAVSDYQHDEIEIEDGVEALGTRFSNDTRSLRLEVEQKRVGRLTGRMGVDWFGRAYKAEGEEALAPPTTQSSLAAFAYEEMGFGATRLQFGARVERNAYRPDPRAEVELGDEHDDHDHEAPEVRDRNFTGGSASFGVHRDLGVGTAVVANLSLASRAPALEELYNFGPHVGNLAFEIGNPDLALERTLGLDVSLRRRSERMSGELNLYSYGIRNFVFLDFTGEEADRLREAEFVQADSRFVGMEATGDIQLGRGVHLDAGMSLVRARLTASDEHLPRIPAMSGRLRLEIPVRSLTLLPEVVITGRQSRVFRDETVTDGSTLLNVSATYFVVRGHATHALTLKAHNLTNETYRLHTSFIKDLAPEMGRGVTATYTVRFF
jgi:iron complex outermembrane receptor protein